MMTEEQIRRMARNLAEKHGTKGSTLSDETIDKMVSAAMKYRSDDDSQEAMRRVVLDAEVAAIRARAV